MTHDLCPIMLFSGKGGVGKTTLAAATAVRLAQSGSRVLIISTDPAHSLSDVFDHPLRSEPTRVIEHLDAIELDAKQIFDLPQPQNDALGNKTIHKLMSIASQTPGIDEFGAIEVLMQAIADQAHDVVILDTAPTGHTLRLLMLPELLDGWLGTLLSLKSQFAKFSKLFRRLMPKSVSETQDLALEEGIQSSREQIHQLRSLLMDPQKAQIFLVTIAEAMSILETERTLDLLKNQGMPVGSVIVNQIQPEHPECEFCNRRHTIHQKELEKFRKKLVDIPLRMIESQPKEIRGHKALSEIADLLWQ